MRKVFLPYYNDEHTEVFKRLLKVESVEIVHYTMLTDILEILEQHKATPFSPGSSLKDCDALLLSVPADNIITPDIYKKLTNINIPTLIITPPEQYSSVVKTIKYHPLIEIFNSCYGPGEFQHTIGRLVSIIERSPCRGVEVGDFTIVNKRQILNFTHYPTDLYLRLSQSKIIKIFNRGDDVEESKVQKYATSGYSFLLVKSQDHQAFINQIRHQIKATSKKIKSLDFNKKLELSVSECHLVAQVLPLFQVDEKFLGVMNDLLNHVFDLVKESSSLNQLFGKRGPLTGREKKLSTALTASILAKKHMKADQNDIGKLIVASFFCDISLDQAGVKPLDLDEAASFSYLKQAKIKYLNHPNESVESISKFININLDASAIIREHHELPDGTGFPKQLRESDIHPLSKIFILSSYVVDFISDNSDQYPTPEEVLIACQRKFSPFFESLLSSLSEAMLPTGAPHENVIKKAS